MIWMQLKSMLYLITFLILAFFLVIYWFLWYYQLQFNEAGFVWLLLVLSLECLVYDVFEHTDF
uniref:Uncharacterized protein n=1 Tax=Arundo donax TaxID=35708 RepID=A0A0A9GAM0_ARUDO